jgi:hypothetical protein
LPTAYVVALYWQRWRIEDAYALVKRLLALAYVWCGNDNAKASKRPRKSRPPVVILEIVSNLIPEMDTKL